MKLSCCMLVRDDASTLEACLKSIRPHVDELCVLDTGSVDDSPNIAREYADRWEYWTGCNDAEGRIEDFAAARNKSFSLATGDWVCWLDADDVVVGAENLRKLAAECMVKDVRFIMPYEYAHDAAGRITLLQYRERLMRPLSNLRWQSPVHEICMLQNLSSGSVADIMEDSVRFVHRQSKSTKLREPARNLRILQNYIRRVGDTDPRALYYYGGELAKHGQYGAAVTAFKRHIELDTWPDQRCRAMLEVGNIYAQLGFHDDAIRWYSDAMFVRNWPEPMLALARVFFSMARTDEAQQSRKLDKEQLFNLKRAAQWFFRGLQVEPLRDALLFTDPMERGRSYELLAASLAALGDANKCLDVCEMGLKMVPESELLQANYLWAKQHGSKGKATQPSVKALSVPSDLRVEAQKPEQGKLDLVFFLGPAYEPWSPDTWAKTGMGGSETMAWELARRLRKRGHRVRLYTECTTEQEGLYEGVEWLNWQRFRNVRCDVLIASRVPWAVRDELEAAGRPLGRCKYTAAVLWVHDIHVGPFATEEERRFDRILCLSEWHRSFFCSGYAHLDKSKVHVTRNGIDLSRFERRIPEGYGGVCPACGDEDECDVCGNVRRNPHRAIYSSSPDRGLLAAVLAWPRIREQVPDAELHCFYGFSNWEKGSANDPAQLAAIARLKQLCATTPGVVMRDRVDQKELAREFMRAGVWVYGTWFTETSCITAMEAQAAGCHIVTSPVAALVETAGDRAHMLEEPWGDVIEPRMELVNELAEWTVLTMRLPPNVSAQNYAREHFGLDSLADEWSAMLLELEAERALNPVPSFRGAAE